MKEKVTYSELLDFLVKKTSTSKKIIPLGINVEVDYRNATNKIAPDNWKIDSYVHYPKNRIIFVVIPFGTKQIMKNGENHLYIYKQNTNGSWGYSYKGLSSWKAIGCTEFI